MQPLRIRSTLATGLLTILPLWITWLVFRFVLGLLAEIGSPLVAGLVNLLAAVAPAAAERLNSQWILYTLALVLTVLALYLVGWLARLVIGQRLIHLMEAVLERIPLVHTIYGGTKKLMSVLERKPGNLQRVVLIEFPRRGLKAVGLVTRVMTEEPSGRELAAVFVPTTPNPTSGYLEVVPTDELTPTDWTMDQAMAFIISGGAVAPDTMPGMTVAELGRTSGNGAADPE